MEKQIIKLTEKCEQHATMFAQCNFRENDACMGCNQVIETCQLIARINGATVTNAKHMNCAHVLWAQTPRDFLYVNNAKSKYLN